MSNTETSKKPSRSSHTNADREVHKSEEERLDEAIEDSMEASDPPASYGGSAGAPKERKSSKL
jgi:hypothetical protein